MLSEQPQKALGGEKALGGQMMPHNAFLFKSFQFVQAGLPFDALRGRRVLLSTCVLPWILEKLAIELAR